MGRSAVSPNRRLVASHGGLMDRSHASFSVCRAENLLICLVFFEPSPSKLAPVRHTCCLGFARAVLHGPRQACRVLRMGVNQPAQGANTPRREADGPLAAKPSELPGHYFHHRGNYSGSEPGKHDREPPVGCLYRNGLFSGSRTRGAKNRPLYFSGVQKTTRTLGCCRISLAMTFGFDGADGQCNADAQLKYETPAQPLRFV